MRIFEPENAFWKGAKKHEVKKVIKLKNDRNKSCPKFYKLGDEFFLFDKISKLWILEPKNVFPILHIKHVLKPPKIKVLTKKIIATLKNPREII